MFNKETVKKERSVLVRSCMLQLIDTPPRVCIFVSFTQKYEYKVVGERYWYKADKDGSFISWGDARWVKVNYNEINELIVVKLKFATDEGDANDGENDSDEKKQDIPDRRQAYKFNSGLSDPKNWTKSQNEYAKQCKCSFEQLCVGSLQFVNDYWHGYIVCSYIPLSLSRICRT